MAFVGIDYSMTSPAVCVHEGDVWDPSACTFYFFKKKMDPNPRFVASVYPEWTHPQQRFQNLTSWTMDCINKHDVTAAAIEGYALGATSNNTFNIAENTGLMKYALWLNKTPFVSVAPMAVKKYATGKGNSKKDVMIKAFEDEVGLRIHEVLGTKEGNETPASDIADSYWICKWGFHESQKLLDLEVVSV